MRTSTVARAVLGLAAFATLPFIALAQVDNSGETVDAVVKTTNLSTYKAVMSFAKQHGISVSENVVLPGGKRSSVGIEDLTMVDQEAGRPIRPNGTYIENIIHRIFKIPAMSELVNKLGQVDQDTYRLRAVVKTGGLP